MMIAEILRGNGRKPGILSRGYGGNSKNEINVVCDGENILLPTEIAGDEAVMMAKRLKNVPILVGSDRYQTGRYAIKHFGVDDGKKIIRLIKAIILQKWARYDFTFKELLLVFA